MNLARVRCGEVWLYYVRSEICWWLIEGQFGKGHSSDAVVWRHGGILLMELKAAATNGPRQSG